MLGGATGMVPGQATPSSAWSRAADVFGRELA
jgi:hypothetical protein